MVRRSRSHKTAQRRQDVTSILNRPNIVDQVIKGERELQRLLSLSGIKSIPSANSKEGGMWSNKGAKIRQDIVKLTNEEVYPAAIAKRARGLLIKFQDNVVLQGHNRWWKNNREGFK